MVPPTSQPSDTPIAWLAGAGVFSVTAGLGAGGGLLVYELCVIDFAPPGRVALYMGLHTFLTGIRGVAAPFVGVWLASMQLRDKVGRWATSWELPSSGCLRKRQP